MLKQNITIILNPITINRLILTMYTNKQNSFTLPTKISIQQKILKHNIYLIINNVIFSISTYGL